MRWQGMPGELDRLLKENAHVTCLGLTLVDPVVGSLLATLTKSPGRMRGLRLTHATIPAADASALASLLALKACSLTELDLTYGYVQDAGAVAIARALRTNRNLVRLSLAHNAVGGGGAAALADTLRANCTLTQASLYSNHLHDAAAVSLAAALASNVALTELNLGRNSIGAVGGQALRQCLQSNQSLVSLGELGTLPLSVSLRTSLEWYLRGNKEAFEAMALEATRATQQREGLLGLLPKEERTLRRQIFELEDSAAVSATEKQKAEVESHQVRRLFAVNSPWP